MNKLWTLASLLCVLFLLAGLAACGGDDDDSSSGSGSYYDDLEEIAVRTDGELSALGDTLEETSETDPDYIEVLQDSFRQASEVLEQAHEEVSDLEPPAEAEDAHSDFLAALDSQQANSSNLSDALQDASTIDEVNDAFDAQSGEFSASDANFETTCNALQAVADAAEAGVDLGCGEE